MTASGRLRSLLQPSPEVTIDTPERWSKRREELKELILSYLGRPPYEEAPPPVPRILKTTDGPHYRHVYLAYDVSPGEEVRAHLLIPPPTRRKGGAAVLCLHGTSPEAKDTQLGAGSKPGRDWGRFLATHGYITLSPDHLCAGERLEEGYAPYDTAPFYRRHPHWSAVGKAIWDGQRALDVLCALPEVDAARLGVVGHSLGGHGSVFVAAFDERVRAAVSSCGLTTWTGNPLRLKWARDHWYSYIPALRPIFLTDEEPPFDLHEFAALIAPRAFLNISGMSDPTYGNNETLPELGLRLFELYQMLGRPEAFANFLFGAGHDVPEYSRALTLAWFDHWLCQ